MTIKTERLILEPISQKHFLSTHCFASDPANTRFMMYLPFADTEETQEFITEAAEEIKKEKPSYYEMAVMYGGVHIGTVSLYLSEDRTSSEVGWIMDRQYQGQGFASEAASALIRYAADVLGIHHFSAHCDTENTASRRVMEKLGMELKSEHGGRKNRLSDEERREYLFELDLF
ncbi:MAG: GNAT family N-acetyltransferase [Ruminococcus sp.]|nr:GNAT family N-acetyltransferase [Ruminococcus sp.]